MSTEDEIAAPEKPKAKKNKAPEFPTRLKMTKNFRVEYPLPGRLDASMRLSFVAGQEITDKNVIKHLLLNPHAPFVVKE